MNNEVFEYKCPTCGQALRFDPKISKLACDFCNKTYDMMDENFDMSQFENEKIDENQEEVPIYVCQSCGAEIVARKEETSLTCPYCSSNIILTSKLSGNMKPDGIIPFKITKEELPDLLTNFFKSKKLLPKGFVEKKKLSKITGIYVPFWVFDGNVSGRLKYEGLKEREYRDGDYIVTETKHYDVIRDAYMEYRNVPCDASERIDDDLMDSIEPFEMYALEDFDMNYLAGFAADRFDVPQSGVSSRASRRMLNTGYREADHRASSGYSSVSRIGGSLHPILSARYLLMPVYLYEVIYDDVHYKFAVNGQTGKVVGELPIDGKMSFLFYLRRFLISLPIALAITIAIWYFGG